MTKTLQLKRGIKEDIPVLAEGEIGFVTDTKEVFVGDGSNNVPILTGSTTGWNYVKDTLTAYFDTLYQAVSTAILASIGTAKGDLITFSEEGVPVRLGVGTNGQIPVADSSAGGGIKWADLDEYSLPVASDSSLGGVKVGAGLSIDEGVLSADVQSNVLTINEQSSNYTLALADQDAIVDMNRTQAQTVTVPKNDTVDFPIGAQILVRQKSVYQVTIAAASGVTVVKNSGFNAKTSGRYSLVGLVKMADNTWTLFGDLEQA